MDDPKVFDAKLKVKNLYELVYPYGKFNNDYAHACIAIRRELQQLCKDKRKDLLVVINRALELRIKPTDSLRDLCNNIINNVIDRCLSIPDAKLDVMLNLTKGIVPTTKALDVPQIYDSGSVQKNDPILVTREMQNFFQNANLGPSDPYDPNSTPLNQVLLVGYNGITTRYMLSKLFKIYNRVSQYDRSLMEEYFGSNYFKDSKTPEEYIIRDNIILQNKMSAEDRERLQDPEIVKRLNQEFDLVSTVLGHYLSQNSF